MLVLSRKVGESILINDDIEVQVVGIYKDKIKLGITAPKDVRIFRNEIYGTPPKNTSDIADYINSSDIIADDTAAESSSSDAVADSEDFCIIDYSIDTDNDDIF